MSGVVFGVVVSGVVDDVERRMAVDVPMVVDEAEDVCWTSEVGIKKATWEVGTTACTLAAAVEVTGDGSAALLDVEEGRSVLVLAAEAVRVGFDHGSSDWAAGTG